jgi:hypothetical protein
LSRPESNPISGKEVIAPRKSARRFASPSPDSESGRRVHERSIHSSVAEPASIQMTAIAREP